MKVGRLPSLLVATATLLGLAQTSGAADAPPIDFVKDVQPILQARCFSCHGPEKQKSGLRLDDRASALRGGDGGALFVAGKPGESELLKRITSTEETERMPPEGDPLSASQIAVITRWIELGAAWPETGAATRVLSQHWAFQPLRLDPVPPVQATGWVRNEIDRFILARLEAEGVTPAPEADRHTLIKRLSYDLVGLPPTPDEVDEFLADGTGDTYEKLVERLLRSPHFGERWGRHWLDKARYADSDGYEKDNPRPHAWYYRDWVIQAVNNDLPFDQFTIEQLAGDLLPEATQSQRLATAFHRQTLTNTEGGADQEQFRNEACFDRVATTGSVWLGLTVGCAQCHSHKYDPITQAEYYQLFAFFNNGDETTLEVPLSAELVAKYELDKAAHDKQVQDLQAQLEPLQAALTAKLPAWEADLQAKLKATPAPQWHMLEISDVRSSAGSTFKRLDDGSYLAEGTAPLVDDYTVTVKTADTGITAIRVEALADEQLPSRGPGRVAHGNFVLSEFRAAASPSEQFTPEQELKFAGAEADFSQGGWDVAAAIDGKPETGWAISPQIGRDHAATFRLQNPVGTEGTTWLRITLSHQYGQQHTLGRFRLQVRTGAEVEPLLTAEIRAVLAVEPAARTPQQQTALRDFYVGLDPQAKALKQQLVDLQKKVPPRPVAPLAILAQRQQNPRTTRILRRGDFLQPQADVQPATLGVLPPFQPRAKEGAADRLDLARWLVAEQNALTPRVAVNQVWSHLFGRGIVRTVNDFGVRGEPPTHPELLDWLAGEFRRRGWSRKELIRLIVSSAAYRQSSQNRPDLAQRDAQNILLARQNRFRVEAEIIRDLSLAVSGLLSPKVGGPSVFPPLPPDVAALSYAGNFRWNASTGEDRYRRGMYTFFKRTAPHPNLATFDCPDANTTTVERRTSNTPLQALVTLNNETFSEAAQAFAGRIVRSPQTGDPERLTAAFRLAVTRPPAAAELAACQQLLDDGRAWFKAHPEEAGKLTGTHRPPEVAVDEVAAWVATTRILLNLDEFVTRE